MRVIVVLLFAVASLWCQSQTATLTGSVLDASGAVVPDVSLRLTNTETGEAFVARSNEQGAYVLPLVKPGPRYMLVAEKAGFKTFHQTDLVLETGAQILVEVRLEVGSQTERIVVEAVAPQLQTQSSSVGAVVDNRTIINMPLIDRRAAQLARLNGFVVQNGNGSNFTMAGGRGDNSMWLIDGANAQNVLLGVQTLSFDPPIEALQEFNVSISNYAAELGRTGGGVVQMTTKSGTNQIHGSAYEYLRNDALDARTFFSDTKPILRYNLFGASLGGPVRKDRTHFFFSYEGRRQIDQNARLQNVPTSAEVRGDFSVGSRIVRDPAATGRPPFPGNVIPPARLDPIGRQLAALYPEPNVAGRGSGDANYRSNPAGRNPQNVYVTRLDHIFSTTDRIFGRLLASNGNNLEYGTWPVEVADPFSRRRDNSYYNVSGTWFRNLRPTIINEFRGNWDRRKFINRTGGAYSGLNGQLGIPGVDPEFAPLVTVAGYANIGNDSNQERLQVPIRGNHFADHLLFIRGSHSVKTGFEFRYGRNDDVNRNRAGGQFGFNDVATGHSLASLLLGWTQSATLDSAVPIRSRMDAYGAFVQDDWRVTRNLTLNIGLRWDMDTPRSEGFDNRQNSFDRFAINPVSRTPGVVTFSGRNGLSKYAHNFDKDNFAPRMGFAWRIGDHWVVRGGGAVVYQGAYDQATPLAANVGFGAQGNFVSADNGLTAALLLRDGIPTINPPREADLTPGFGAVPLGMSPFISVEFFEPAGRATGYLETFNLNVQRQLPWQMLVELGYVGTLGHKLPSTSTFNINQVRPELMGPGNAQLRRPFPQFTGVSAHSASIGNSNYHAMNLRVDKRTSSGIQFQANYTWSRNIDDLESRNELGGAQGNGFMNSYDRRADRGLSGNHISHRLITNMVWQLPVGRGRAWDAGPIGNAVAGGWTLGYIGEFRSGPAYGVAEQVNRTNSFSASNRPNVVGDPVIAESRSRAAQVEAWFNTSAFAEPAQFTFGNAGKTNGYGPGAVVMDLSILRDLRFAERYNLQIRCEMLNFLNKPNFGLPNLNRGNAAFGRITGLAPGNQARIIQLGLHFKF
jgi:hypothetical protein